MTRSHIVGGGSAFDDIDSAQAAADAEYMRRHGDRYGVPQHEPEDISAPDPSDAPGAVATPDTDYIAPRPRRFGDRLASVAEPVRDPEPEEVQQFDEGQLRSILDKLIAAAERNR